MFDEGIQRNPHLAKVITMVGRTQPHLLPFKVDADAVPEARQALAMIGLKKPFFTSADSFVANMVLTRPEIFDSLSPTIELSARVSDLGIVYWRGNGMLKDRGTLEVMAALNMLSFPDVLLMEIDIQQVLDQLLPFLELPSSYPQPPQASAPQSIYNNSPREKADPEF